MATSNSIDFELTEANIILEILERLRVAQNGQTIPGYLSKSVERTMNLVIKAWQTKTDFLHTRTWTTKTFSASDEVTGTDGNIYTCIKSHTSASDNKPITGADYTTYWELKGTTGGTWVTATSYIAIGEFTAPTGCLSIEKAFIREESNHDYQVAIVTLNEYLDILDKGNTGRPYLLTFDKQLTPKVYLYYQPNQTDYVLHYLYERRLEDFDSVANTPDLPVEFTEAFITEVAFKCAKKFNVPQDIRLELKAESMEAWRNLKNAETGNMPDLEGAF